MTSHAQAHDAYYENLNLNLSQRQLSPSLRQPQHPVQRQSSRPFDNYGNMPFSWPSVNPADDQAVQNYVFRCPDGRMNATLGAGYPSYDSWNSPLFTTGQSQNHTLAAMGVTNRRNPVQTRPGRAGLPMSWMDQSVPGMQAFSGPEQALDSTLLRNDPYAVDEAGDDLIPTAIVIKNIPFAVKKEFLVGLMTEIGLPLPYAFNYHFDQGVFRGLAFANFTTADETAMVIHRLNHYELQGRKLRVEYKKMLPLAERERIEREKRIKRGQLEEQHRTLAPSQLQNQPSLSSLTSQLAATSPSPVSARPRVTGSIHPLDLRSLPPEVDFNDPAALSIYGELYYFKMSDAEEMSFPATLQPTQRRLVHTLAHHLHLGHTSRGEGVQRAVQIFRYPEQSQISPSNFPAGHPLDSHRRALNRAATTDFSDARSDGFYNPHSVTRQTSGLFSAIPDSPALPTATNLRAAKSFADLRAYTPSPAQSLPANLNNGLSRFGEYALSSTAASNPNLTATTTSQSRDEPLLINGLGAMALGPGFGSSGSPRSTRNLWDRDVPTVGAIGSNRGLPAHNLDDSAPSSRSQLPLAQRSIRGPAPERGLVASRQTRQTQNGQANARTTDELHQRSSLDQLVE